MVLDTHTLLHDQKMTRAWTERRQFERYIRPEVLPLRYAHRLLGSGQYLIPGDPPVACSGPPWPSCLKWLDLD